MLLAAIDAQGGRAALAQLDDVRIVSEGRFKGVLPARRTIHYRAPDTWSMTIEFEGGGEMRFGMAGDRCWRSERHLAAACSENDQENARIATLHNARMLHRIDEAEVRPAGTVEVDGRDCPAIRVGAVTLGFDPASHRLIQIRLEDRIDTLSDYRTLGGVLVAARRVLTIAGKLDMDETWIEVVPGGADPEALRVPEPPRDGLIVDHTDPARVVAWTLIDNPETDVRAAIERLDAFIRAHDRRVSNSDGVILTAPGRDPEVRQWRLAVGVEGGPSTAPISENSLHIEHWPATRIAGVFYKGDPLGSEAKRAALMQALRERGLAPAPATQWQILFPRAELDRPVAERISFLRIAVQ